MTGLVLAVLIVLLIIIFVVFMYAADRLGGDEAFWSYIWMSISNLVPNFIKFSLFHLVIANVPVTVTVGIGLSVLLALYYLIWGSDEQRVGLYMYILAMLIATILAFIIILIVL